MNQKYILFSFLFIVLFTIHYNSGKENKYNTFSDTVLFGGDQWEYQSLAVNLLNGHGYRFGGIEPLEEYKFDYTSRYKTFFDSETHYSFYRTPGYPFFLKTIYQFYGVHPRVVKKFQLIMIVISACLMPLVCYYYFGFMGIISGTISSFLFMKYFCSDFRAGSILTESLILFSVLVWMISLIFWEKKPSNFRVFILGIISGLLLLVKGSTIFMPFTFILFLFGYYRSLGKSKFLQIIIYSLSVVLTIAPWSIYASLKSNKVILLSTQGDVMLVDYHNKQAALTGEWSTNWPSSESNLKYLFFERPKGTTKKHIVTALNFYKENPWMIFTAIKNKIIFAIQYRPTKYCLIFFLLHLFLTITTSRFQAKYRFQSIPSFSVIIFINIFLLTTVFQGSRRFLVPYMYFLLMPSIHFLFLIPNYITMILETSGLNKKSE